MKILKAKIETNHEGNKTTNIHPDIWIANKERIPTVLYPQDRTDEIVENGKLYKIAYPVVPDDLADEFIKDPNFSLADKTELTVYSNKHCPVRNITTDQNRVNDILAKIALDKPLTQEDKDAINPDHPAKGINKSQSFIELAQSYGVII